MTFLFTIYLNNLNQLFKTDVLIVIKLSFGTSVSEIIGVVAIVWSFKVNSTLPITSPLEIGALIESFKEIFLSIFISFPFCIIVPQLS